MKVQVPGDKSISQRALILAALARGESRIRGILDGGDPASTAGALRALGAAIPPLSEWKDEIRVPGLGLHGLKASGTPLDLGNSGTGARLMAGVLSGEEMDSILTGDASLRSRPMKRVTQPLSRMGARFQYLENEGRLPLKIRGGSLRPMEYTLPVASAQVKSAILLAGVVGGVPLNLLEPGPSRDHTEGMLRASGVPVETEVVGPGRRVVLLPPPSEVGPLDLDVPADFSSAAFFLLFGLLAPPTEPLVLPGVGLNPTRTGLLPVLERMGGRVRVEGKWGEAQGEPLGDLVVEPSPLRGTRIEGEEIPTLIDEIPILAVGAARAQGATIIRGAGELRVKETDRIRALAENLRAVGVEAEELEDGLEIQGSDGPLEGRVRSFGDHRIAMAFGILGALPGCHIEVDHPEVATVSFPAFWELLEHLPSSRERDPRLHADASPPRGAQARGPTVERGGMDSRAPGPGTRPLVITLDGPAGSGKSSTAREVARRLGYKHLDSGALYRALTYALLNSGIPQEEWEGLSPAELDRFPIHLRASEDGLQVLLGDRILTDELRTPEVTALVSPLSAFPAVRAWLLEAQRRAGREGGLVADGRDMGTVVFPDAELKVFLTARLPERAHRRFLEREGRPPGEEELDAEADAIRQRDERDAGRSVAPLKKPGGAVEVDTSELSFEAQVKIIIEHAKTLTHKLFPGRI